MPLYLLALVRLCFGGPVRTLCFVLLLALTASAQRPEVRVPGTEEWTAPVVASAAAAAYGRLAGSVTDSGEGLIPGATVTLQTGEPQHTETAVCDDEGTFHFDRVPAGSYMLTVSSPGFEAWTESGTLARGEDRRVVDIAMTALPVTTTVHVVARAGEVAQAQLHLEEQQRVLGVFPNFYATYLWNADPLTARQKMQLAWRFSVDPTAFGMAGAVALAEQRQHAFPGYGWGAKGFAKRFGASYADGFNSTLLGQAVLPSLLHQDPRYFVKGVGSVRSRVLYALASAVICKGDNGRWQPNYSNMLGNLGAAGLSNLYYPAGSHRGLNLTMQTAGISTAMGAAGGLIQEFLLHHMTPGIPDYRGVAASR